MERILFKDLEKVEFDKKDISKKKMGWGGELSYLSWAKAWQIAREKDPDAKYEVVYTPEGCLYWHDDSTAWVRTRMTMFGETLEMLLPIMDAKNNAMPLGNITARDASDSIMRCLTKNIALFGIGLALYAGEDLIYIGEDAPVEEKPVRAKDGTVLGAGVKAPQKKLLSDDDIRFIVAKMGEAGISGDEAKRQLGFSLRDAKTPEQAQKALSWARGLGRK